MSQCVAGSTITMTVLITDNSSMWNTPNGTPQPVAVDTATVTLITPSGQTPVVNSAMSPGSYTGYYTFSYQSSLYDEVGTWRATFFAQSGSTVGYEPPVEIFTLISAL